MRIYWPNAIMLKENGTRDQLFTYDGATCIDDAYLSFQVWRDEYHFNLVQCWIDVFEDGVFLQSLKVDLPPHE